MHLMNRLQGARVKREKYKLRVSWEAWNDLDDRAWEVLGHLKEDCKIEGWLLKQVAVQKGRLIVKWGDGFEEKLWGLDPIPVSLLVIIFPKFWFWI